MEDDSYNFKEEAESLRAIYLDDCLIDDESRHVVLLFNKEGKNRVRVSIFAPTGYPKEYPQISISSSFVNRELEEEWLKRLKDDLEGNIGYPLLFTIADNLGTMIDDYCEKMKEKDLMKVVDDFDDVQITVGEAVKDRKSKFIAYAGRCSTREEAFRFRKALLFKHKATQTATHNIFAFKLKSGECYRDDDGENNAGDKLLFLLVSWVIVCVIHDDVLRKDALNVEDVVVIVTRWYGGIHLGPDRFKHISERARLVLLEVTK